MSIWTVKPEEVAIDLRFVAQGGATYPFTIRIKKYLTVGEERRVMTAGWRGMNSTTRRADGAEPGPEIQIDWRAQTFARTEAYLLDWSLTDDGKRLDPRSRDVIESLSPDVYALIENAITAHVEAMTMEKKRTAGSAGPEAMSA